MALSLVTPPAVEPVTLADLKAHLRITTSDEDALLTSYLRAARQYIDGKDGIWNRALITQTWDWTLDAFPTSSAESLRVPLPPLQSVTSVQYLDVNGVTQTWPSANYTIDTKTEPGWIAPAFGQSYPAALIAFNAVTVRFVAGYGPTGADVPEPLL